MEQGHCRKSEIVLQPVISRKNGLVLYSNTHIMKQLRIKNLEAEMWLSKHNIDKIHFSLKIAKTEACEAEGLNIIPCLYQK